MLDVFSMLDHFEYPVVQFINSFGSGTFIDVISMTISNVAFMVFAFGLGVSFLYVKKNSLWKPLLFSLFVAIIMHFIINEGFFKTVLVYFDIFRPRPYIFHSDLHPIGYQFLDSSFPSSHMAFTTLMVVILSYFSRSFIVPGIIVIICMGLSRIHNAMHYPSDVLFGSFMGFLYALSGIYLMKIMGFHKQPWYKRIISRIF